MDVTSLIIQALSGAVGGNLGGILAKAKSLGPVMNTVLGALGGVGGGAAFGGTAADLIGNGTIGTAAASGIAGLILPILGGMLKKPQS